MGGGGSKNQTTTQETKLPDWLNTYAQGFIGDAWDTADRPYQGFDGTRVAPLSGLQERGIDLAWQGLNKGQVGDAMDRATAGAEGAQAGMGTALDAAGGLLGLSGDTGALVGDYQATAEAARSGLPGRAESFFNPYLGQVEQAAIGNLTRTAEQQRAGIGDRFETAGAFGGDRHGIAEGVLSSETARSAGELSGQLRHQGFTTAQDLAARSLQLEQAGLSGALAARAAQGQQLAGAAQAGVGGAQAAATAAGLAGAPSSLALSLAQGGMQLGQLPRDYNQALIDTRYSDWREERDYPVEQLSLKQAAIAGTPYGGSTTVSRPIYGPSPWTGAATGALSGAAAGVPLAGATYGLSIPIGALIGAGAGYYGGR